MIGYIIVTLLLTVAYSYFTYVVAVNPAITRTQRFLQLAMIWLVPIFGLVLVSYLYSRRDVDPRDNLGRGNPYQ